METSSIDKLTRQGQAAVGRSQAAGRRGTQVLGDMVSQARSAATDASDSVLAYTKKNPAKALGIAAVAGAILFAIAKANAMRRD